MDSLQMVEVEHSHQEEAEVVELNHLFMMMLLQDLTHIKVLVSQADLVVELVKKMVQVVVHQHKIR